MYTLFSLDDYITDANSIPVIESLRELCESSRAISSPIIIIGPSGVGKTLLCKAIKAESENTIYCTSEDFSSLFVCILENNISVEHFFEIFEDFNVIIDDVDSLISYSQMIRIHERFVETHGKIMQRLITELILRQRATGNYVVLTFNHRLRRGWYADFFEETLLSGETIDLQYPNRETRIQYCKKCLFEKHIEISDETAATIIDSWDGNTIPKINGIVNNIVARRTINAIEEILPK